MDASLWRLRAAFAQRIIPTSHPHIQFQVFRSLASAHLPKALSTQVETSRCPPGWAGLDSWRQSGVNNLRRWGDKAPIGSSPPPMSTVGSSSLADYGRKVLLSSDPLEKADLTHQAWREYLAGGLPIGTAAAPASPSRPPKPELLPARLIPSMKQANLPLNVYTLHNLAHVELNAIDLAWDTIVRFSPLKLPEPFYADFARVADDEGRHFRWCLQRLEELGYEYGCMPAHNLLWDGCALSAGDIRARLAVVPMSQEARGLDAGGRLADRLVGWGDNRSAAIVAKIAEEERAHVGVGVAWFSAICGAEGVDPGSTFARALMELYPDLLRGGSFNHTAREEVGLLRVWYDETLWAPEMQNKAEAAHQRAKEQAIKEKESGGEVVLRGLMSAQVDKTDVLEEKMKTEELRKRLKAMLAIEINASY